MPILDETSTFAQRLQHLVDTKANGRVSVFARMCEIGESTVRKYLDGSIPGITTAVEIADRCEVDLLWLCTGRGDQVDGERHLERGLLKAAYQDCLLVPRYEGPTFAGKERVIERIPFARQIIAGLAQSDPQLLGCYRMGGDGMERALFNEDWLLFDMTATDLKSEDIYLINIGGETFVKRLRRLPGSIIEVISDNREKYSPISYNEKAQQSEGFQVCGRFLWRGGTRF